jgi:MFS family permease
MDKYEILNSVRQLAAQNLLNKQELLEAFYGSSENSSVKAEAGLKISDILYFIGAAIIFLGVSVLVYQNWDVYNSITRIAITIGSCLAAFIVAIVLNKYENFQKASNGFFMLFGLLAPLALNVVFFESGVDYATNSIQAAIFAILAAVFASAFYYFRKTILLLFLILFSSGLFHFVINLLVGSNFSSEDQVKIYEYRFLILGLGYMLLGYYFSSTLRKSLSGFLNGFGSLMFLGSAMALGGYSPNENIFWELIYPVLVFGLLFLSVYVKSKAYLVFGSLFLIGYILKLTGEYFTTGLGWPLALVLAGLAIMGVGYYAVKLNKKYFQAHV